MVKGTSVNQVLDKACEIEGAEYCVVQCVGHLIKTSEFFKFIEKWIEIKDFFCKAISLVFFGGGDVNKLSFSYSVDV